MNKIKWVEIRSTATKEWKDYLSGKTDKKPEPSVWYIYFTQGGKHEPDYYYAKERGGCYAKDKLDDDTSFEFAKGIKPLNGKVVGRFVLKEVEAINLPYTRFGTKEPVGCEAERKLQTKTMDEPMLLEASCLTEEEIYEYLRFSKEPYGYAWHIDDLEIFPTPKELKDFKRPGFDYPGWAEARSKCGRQFAKEDTLAVMFYKMLPLKRPPQSWCYVSL